MLHVRFLSLFCNFFCLLVSHHLTRSADETRRNLTDSCLWRLLHSTCSTFESLRSARVVHGDIRPQNLLVLPDWRVVLQHLLLRANDEWAGDKRYFAPDVARCMYQRTSITADQMWSNEIWALGASLYELCTGQKLIVVNEKASSTFILKKLNAFTPLAADTVVYAANAKLNRLILDMLNVVPAQRPRAADILQRLEKLRAETPALYAAPLPTSSSSSTTTRASKSSRASAPQASASSSAAATAATSTLTAQSKKRKQGSGAGDASGEPSSDAPTMATPLSKKASRVTFAASAAATISTTATTTTTRKRKPGEKDASTSATAVGGTLALNTVTDAAIPLPAHPELPVVASTSVHHADDDDDSDEVPYGTPNERGVIRLARRDRFAAALVGIRGTNAPAWMVEAERVRDVGIVAQRAKQREVPCPCGKVFSEVAALQEHGAECESFQEETQRTGMSPAIAVAIPPPHAAKLDPLAAGAPLNLPSRKRLTTVDVCVAPPALLARVQCHMATTGRKSKQAMQQALIVASSALLKNGGAGAITVAPSTATVRLYVPRDAQSDQFGVSQLAAPLQAPAPVFAAAAAAAAAVPAANVAIMASAFPDWIDQADLMPAPPQVARIGRPPKVPPAAFWCVCGGDFDTPYAKANHIMRCARFKNAKSTGQLEQLLEIGRVMCVCGLTLPTPVRKSQHAVKCKEFQTWRHSNPRK
jgi:hypothetical protein